MGRAIQPIISGAPSGAEHDAVVVLATFEEGSRRGLCSATMVAPNLVLTARHCVSNVDDEASCATDGSAVLGAELHGDVPAGELVVFAPDAGVVPTTTDATQASARGVALVVDEAATTICNRDLAFVVLDRPLAGKVATIRLGAPTVAERLTAVGWGVTESGALAARRMERAGLAIAGAGPRLYPDDARSGYGDSEFLVGESACLGDSGGPILAPSGALVGVASRAGNGEPRDPANLAATCTGASAHVVYSHLGSARSLVWRAFLRAGAVPSIEPTPLASAESDDRGDPGTSAATAPRDDLPAGPPGSQILSGAIDAETDPAERDASSDGCRIGGRPADGAAFTFAALVLGPALRRRTRARRQAKSARIGTP